MSEININHEGIKITFSDYPSPDDIYEALQCIPALPIGTHEFESQDGELRFIVIVNPDDDEENPGLNIYVTRNLYIFRIVPEYWMKEYIALSGNEKRYPHFFFKNEFGSFLIIKAPRSRGFLDGKPDGDEYRYAEVVRVFEDASDDGCPRLLIGKGDWVDQASGFYVYWNPEEGAKERFEASLQTHFSVSGSGVSPHLLGKETNETKKERETAIPQKGIFVPFYIKKDGREFFYPEQTLAGARSVLLAELHLQMPEICEYGVIDEFGKRIQMNPRGEFNPERNKNGMRNGSDHR